jgi:hypothetical protein
MLSRLPRLELLDNLYIRLHARPMEFEQTTR